MKSYTDLECQRLGQGDGGGGFKILPGTVGLRRLAGLRGQGVEGTLVPLLVVALELESQAHTIVPHVLVFVAGVDSGKPLVERVAVAGQSEKEGVLMGGKSHCAGAAPTLLGIVEELRDSSVDGGARRNYFELDAHMFRRVAAQHVVAYFARGEFLLEAHGQPVQDSRVQLLPDQRQQIFAQARAEPLVLLIGDVGLPALAGDDHRIDRVALVHIQFGVLRSGEEEVAHQ